MHMPRIMTVRAQPTISSALPSQDKNNQNSRDNRADSNTRVWSTHAQQLLADEKHGVYYGSEIVAGSASGCDCLIF